MSSFNKIVWAVDAFEDAANQAHVMPLLGAISRAEKCEIQPLFILSPTNSKLPATSFESVKVAFSALAVSRLEKFVRDSDMASILPLEVLASSESSVRKDAELLLQRAQSKRADLIVLATNARRGVQRWFMGSFAETLALHSPIPLLAINPAGQIRERIRHILFPTNFAPYYRAPFERTVRLAKEWDADITLFYQEPIMDWPMMNAELDGLLEKEELWRQEMAKEWEKWALDQGVHVTSNLENRPGYLVPSICTLAEARNFDLVAMVTDATAAGAVLIGSSVRQVLRGSPCPVLILRVEKSDEYDRQ